MGYFGFGQGFSRVTTTKQHETNNKNAHIFVGKAAWIIRTPREDPSFFISLNLFHFGFTFPMVLFPLFPFPSPSPGVWLQGGWKSGHGVLVWYTTMNFNINSKPLLTRSQLDLFREFLDRIDFAGYIALTSYPSPTLIISGVSGYGARQNWSPISDSYLSWWTIWPFRMTIYFLLGKIRWHIVSLKGQK